MGALRAKQLRNALHYWLSGVHSFLFIALLALAVMRSTFNKLSQRVKIAVV